LGILSKKFLFFGYFLIIINLGAEQFCTKRNFSLYCKVLVEEYHIDSTYLSFPYNCEGLYIWIVNRTINAGGENCYICSPKETVSFLDTIFYLSENRKNKKCGVFKKVDKKNYKKWN
jgi:hypothetical protein